MVLSGGTGTPKLLRGLAELVDPGELTVAVNTADDAWISGNLISPDVDAVLYTLAGMIDEERWWGIKGDTFATHEHLQTLGRGELLAVGDRDRAVQIFRSDLIRSGATLTEATSRLAEALGVKQRVIPMTDDPVRTMVLTPKGELPFQEFWVGRGGSPEVEGVRLEGIDEAKPSPALVEALEEEDVVVIGPSNPVTSTGPILALKGVRERLAKKVVVAVSPLAGDDPFSGPAAKFMRAEGVEVSDRGVASLLGRLDLYVVSEESGYPGPCARENTLMRTGEDSLRVARRLLGLISCL